MVRVVVTGVVARWLAMGGLVLAAGCGGNTAGVGQNAADPQNQSLVPPQIQRPGQLRYFFAGGSTAGPSMVLFENPAAPRVVSLTHPEGSYRAEITSWSRSGGAFAYQLSAEATGIQPYHFMLADLAHGFEPRAVEYEASSEHAYFIDWIGERAIAVQTGVYHNGLDDYGWSGHYLWIDAQQGNVTDLGQLAASSVDSQAFGILPALDASNRHSWASRFGLVYLDATCGLVYFEDPADRQTLLQDCSAIASWSGDSSFLAVTTSTGHQLYQRVDGRLERWAMPALDSSAQAANWSWAKGVAKFMLSTSATGDFPYGKRPLSSLAFGDASRKVLVPVADLPSVTYAGFVTDDLVEAIRPSDADQPGITYLLDTTQLGSNTPLQFSPIDTGASATGSPVASSDSQRIYFPAQPLLEITLQAARLSQTSMLFRETHPVQSVLFRLLNDDYAGLLTTIEPEQVAPGADPSTAFERDHQYLLALGGEPTVIPFATVDLALRSGALGLRTWASAPQLGGILYLGSDERGGFVDWLGFDDIAHKVRLLESPNFDNVDVPPAIGGIAAGQ